MGLRIKGKKAVAKLGGDVAGITAESHQPRISD